MALTRPHASYPTFADGTVFHPVKLWLLKTVLTFTVHPRITARDGLICGTRMRAICGIEESHPLP